MNPEEQPRTSEMAKLFLEHPDHPLVRQQKCLYSIRASLREYDCQIQVGVQFSNGQAIPQVTIVPSPERRDVL
jgi:hypothetical protein